jgi:hypothetical protein
MKKNSIEYVLGMRTFGYNEKILKEANDLISSIHGCNAIEFWDWFFDEYERNDISDFFEGCGTNIDYEICRYLIWRLSVSKYTGDEVLEHIIDQAGYCTDIKDGVPVVDYDVDDDRELTLMLMSELGIKDEEFSENNKVLVKTYLNKQKIRINQNLKWLLKEIKVYDNGN